MNARTIALLVAWALAAGGCSRRAAATVEEQQQEIDRLTKERDELRLKIGEMVEKDPRFDGMPDNTVTVGVPTSLARTLIEKVLGGVADRIELRLANLRVRKNGTIKKVVTIGAYELDVNVVEVVGHLGTGKPDLKFGGNEVAVSLPVKVVSGHGKASIHFKWDGKNVSGAVCGDMDVTRDVDGSVKQLALDAKGTLALASAGGQILAKPRFPETRIRLEVVPSKESWASVQALLDEKSGVCGFVLDKVDIPNVLDNVLGKGFSVKLPVEKLKPVAVPIGIEQQVAVKDRAMTVAVAVGDLAITEQSLWLGANVSVGVGTAGAPVSPASAAPPSNKNR